MSRSQTVEEHWCVEDNGVDTSELLEHHEQQGDDQLWPVWGCHQVPATTQAECKKNDTVTAEPKAEGVQAALKAA